METIERVNPVEQKAAEPRLAMFGKSLQNPEYAHRHRINEDSYGIDQKAGIAIVCDGMGGLNRGDQTSQVARDFLMGRLRGIDTPYPEAAQEQMRQAFMDASGKVNAEVYRSGTTATAVKVIKSGEGLRAIIGHVGDSRAYLVRDRRISLVTEDDSTLAASNLSTEEKRRIQKKVDNAENIKDITTPEEHRYWSQRHQITQYLGKEGSIQPHVYDVPLKDWDIILLTTDGVHDNLTSRQMWIAGTIGHEEGVVNWAIHRANLRATGEEFDEALSQKPIYKRATERIRWKVKGKPKHFRAKGDDMTAVAIRVTP